MSNRTPYAHVGGPQLGSHLQSPTPQRPGSFRTELGPTIGSKLRADPPASLFFGLLTRAPKPEGAGFVELDAIGYARQPLDLEPGASPYTRCNRSTITVGPVSENWPKVTHAAIFDGDGTLLYYGAVGPHQSGARPSGAMEFHPHTIRLKLPVSYSS